MLKLKSPILFIILSILFYSCEKEYSQEGNVVGGTAVFTFAGAPTACTNAVVSGTYTAGTALAATNMVSVTVDVSTTGTYSVSTGTVNGISFTGSGSFTSTGTQVVQLTGSGIPVAGGSFDFTPGSNGCTFSVTVTGGTGATAVFTYNGAPGSCTSVTPAGTYTAGTALTAANTVTISVNVTTIGAWSVSTTPVNGFSFAGTGTFTATGAQSITLVGSGTPVADGPFNFTPSNNGCSFPITVIAGTTATDFITCTIDGVAREFNINLEGISPSIDTFELFGDETSLANTPFFDIGLTKSPQITTGIYDRASLTNLDTYSIAYYDDGVSATGWASGLAGQPDGFTVNVTNFTGTRIEGTFSGTLYDNNGQGTGTKVVTLGKFSVPY